MMCVHLRSRVTQCVVENVSWGATRSVTAYGAGRSRRPGEGEEEEDAEEGFKRRASVVFKTARDGPTQEGSGRPKTAQDGSMNA